MEGQYGQLLLIHCLRFGCFCCSLCLLLLLFLDSFVYQSLQLLLLCQQLEEVE